MSGLKRYDLMCSGHYPDTEIESEDGEWVSADIAADLLVACELLVSDYEDENSAIGDDWYRKAKAAIAKAKGADK